MQDEDPAAGRLELPVEVRVEPAVARVEDSSGDVAEFSVLTLEQGGSCSWDRLPACQ